MSDTVTLAGYDWTGMFIIAGVIVACVIFAWYIDHIAGLEEVLGVIITLMALFGIIIALAVNLDASGQHDHAQRVAAVHNLGYSDITVDGDKFTASDDGIYKSGAFIQVDGDQWIILEGK